MNMLVIITFINRPTSLQPQFISYENKKCSDEMNSQPHQAYTTIMENDTNVNKFFNFSRNISLHSSREPLKESSTARNLYLIFFQRLGNMLFEFAGLYGLQQETNSSGMYFIANEWTAKLIALFPRIKSVSKLVTYLPQGLHVLREEKGGHYDPSLAQKISEAKSDVLVEIYLSECYFIFQIWNSSKDP